MQESGKRHSLVAQQFTGDRVEDSSVWHLCKTCPHDQRNPYSGQIPLTSMGQAGTGLVRETQTHIIIVDHYSRRPEIHKLTGLSSQKTILAIKAVFAVHGIPTTVVTDNETQFSAYCFQQFMEAYILGTADVLNCTHHNWCCTLPATDGQNAAIQDIKLPIGPGLQSIRGNALGNWWERWYSEQYATQHDLRHKAKDPPELLPGQEVWLHGAKRVGFVVSGTTGP